MQVCSGKHDTIKAGAHTFDVEELFNSRALENKPIMLFQTDGAQDESPRLPKRLETALSLFRSKNFDVLVHVTK